MATVKAKFTFTCPECSKVLRTANRPAPGKKVKCPACGEAFVPEIDDEAGATAIQDEPRVKAKPKPRNDDDVAPERPKKKKAKSDDDDDADERPRNKKSRSDESEEDDDDRPQKKKKAKKKSGSMGLMLAVGGGGAFLLLCLIAFGITAFAWPGFLNSPPQVAAKKSDKQAENKNEEKPPVVVPKQDLNNFVLGDANVLMGANVNGLRDMKQLEPLLKQITDLSKGKSKMPAEIENLLRNSEKLIASMQIPPTQPGIPASKGKLMIAILASPDAVAKVKKLPVMGAEETVGKHKIHRPGKRDPDWPPVVIAPSDRILLATEMTDQELIAFLDQAEKNQNGQSPASKFSGNVESSQFWAAWVIDNTTRKELQGIDMLAKNFPQAVPAVQSLQRAKGGSLAIDTTDGISWKVQLNMECENAEDAASVAMVGNEIKKLAQDELDKAGVGGAIPGLPPTLLGDFKTLTFQNVAAVASLNVQVSNQTAIGLFALGTAAKGPDPKVPPPVGGPKGYTIDNLIGNNFNEQSFVLQQGRRVTITVANTLSNPKTDVDLFVFQGKGDKIIAFDQNQPSKDRNCRVEFVVPATDVYRIRVLNRGPATANSCIVSITQK